MIRYDENGVKIPYEIYGAKGGESKPHTPVETPNNLLSVAYAKVLLAVAEGELAGQPTDRDIYLDGTPLQNEDGSYNFGGVKWEWRSGSQDQEAIEEFPEVSTEYSVGIELKDNVQWTRAVTKSQLTDLRVTFQWPALMEQASNGDTNGYKMQYAIDLSTDGGAFQEYQVYTIDGKTNTSYERTHKVKLPKTGSNWTIRARRVTPESSSSTIQDTINVKSYAEVVAVKQRYPNTALLYVEFDSRLFGTGNIPKISVRTKGRVIQVPSNYNPETRNYTGIWDGSFKWAWTNNPAWVFYDLLTQDRFGLGHKVTPVMVDKLALYEIAQYCDVMVDDGTGSGTMEPRHTCNIFIQDKAGAWKVLRDIAGIFNGMTYWDGNKFVAVTDKWEPITNAPMFSRSNVVNGNFDYQAADDKSIYTSALVSYDDPDNHYNTDVEPTFETSQILRWGGDRQTEITAIGCTSRGEAQRKGKYTLITNLYNRTVSFQTGLQGLSADVLPGKIIHVLDPLLGGRPYTGRIKASAGTVITLDRDVTAVAGDILYLTMEDGSSEGRTVVSATDNIVTVSVNYSKPIPRNSVWYLEASDLKSQLFRVTKVTNPSPNVYEIEGVEYNESKYDAIDNGARLEPRPVSVVPPGKQQAPTNLVVSSSTYIEQTMAVTSLVATWDQMPNAVQYEVHWRYNDGDWISAGITGSPTITIKGIYTGNYVVRVRAINAVGVKSVWTTSVSTRLDGKTGGVPALAYLTTTPIIYGIRLNWGFPDGAGDTARTEIIYSTNPNFADAIKLGDYSYPTDMHEMHGLKAGQQFWFWGRLVDRTGNIGPWEPLETNTGVHGTSSVDQSEYQEYFEKQINESALYDLLNDRIDLIDGPPTLPGSVNERVKVVSDQVAQDVSTLNQTIADLDAELTNQINSVQQDLQTQIDAIDMSNTLPYDPTATYTTSQVVLGADRILYQAKQNVPLNTPPPNATYWLDIGQAVITADGLASRVTQTEQDVTNLDGRVTANSTSITGLQAQINDKADATALTSLTTRVTEAEGDIETNAQAITGLQTSVAGKADTSALNALTTRVQTAEGKIDANTSAITNLTTTVNGKADASAVTALSTRVSEAEGNISSQGNAITNLNNQIGNIGGDNLLANSSFEEIVNSTRGKYWNILAAGGTTTPSMVDSPLPQSIKAQRTESSSINPNGYLDVLYINDGIARPKVTAGKQYTLSAWARGTSGQIFRQYMRFYDAAGTAILTPTILQPSLTDTYQRYIFTYTAPANSATATVYAARIINGGSSAAPLWMEVDNVQFQEGAVATSYTPSVTQSVTALVDATSALTTRVSTVEGTVTTQGQSITSLTNRITDAESNIDGQATAISSLQSSVTSVDGKVTVLASSIDSLTAAYRDDDGVGDQNDAMNSWNTLANVTESRKVFADEQQATAERFISVDAQLGANAAAVTTLEQAVATQNSANASRFTQLESSVSNAQGQIAGQATAISSLQTTVTQQGDAITAQTTRVDGIYAQVNPEMVGDDSTLIGRSTKLVGIWTEQSARVEGDVAIGTSVTNLQAQINSNSAAIQQVSSVTTSLDGKTSAMWGVKMEVNSQGQYVAAGIGLGIENGPAGLQSQFLVSADKFAVVNGVNGTVTAPFVVTGGQVFIREALITTAMITNALIGSSITSQTQAAWAGLPATVMTFAGEGSLVMRNPSRANTYVTHTPQASTWVIDGVTRVRIGSW